MSKLYRLGDLGIILRSLSPIDFLRKTEGVNLVSRLFYAKFQWGEIIRFCVIPC